jgi:prolyl-tRNA editing enzyme YbaK/EbsC (Cys-tRNA(Pro) deacylase)
MDGLVGLLGPTTSLSALLALLGVGLGTAGALSAARRHRAARTGRAAPAPATAAASATVTATERFRTLAAGLGVDVEPSEFPQGTRTAVDAAAAVGCDVAAIVKSLVFMVDGGAVLVLTSGANRVDERRLAQELGASEVRKASADEARAATGYAIGGTPPFGHTGDGLTAVLLDPALLEHDRVWAAAGTPSSVFPIAPARLAEVAGARTADVTLAGPA